MDTKVCTKCGEEKPATTEYFYRRCKGRKGIDSICKTCVKENTNRWRKENPERCKELMTKWRKENPERHKELKTKWIMNNNDKYLLQKSLSSKKHRNKRRHYEKTIRDSLSVNYVKKLIYGSYDIPHSEIPQELIEAKRRQLKYSRHLRTLKQIANGRRESIRSND